MTLGNTVLMAQVPFYHRYAFIHEAVTFSLTTPSRHRTGMVCRLRRGRAWAAQSVRSTNVQSALELKRGVGMFLKVPRVKRPEKQKAAEAAFVF
jgi:hypothetical protein